METKSKQQGGKLSSEAVAFTRRLIDAGVPKGFFSSFTYESSIPNLKFALALATLSRVNMDTRGGTPPYYIFTPIALGWCLEEEKAMYHSLFIQGQHNESREIPGDAIYTNQFQPALDSTNVTVVRIDRADCGLKLLLEICRFRFEEQNAVKYLLENRIGLGVAHAKTVASMLFFQPLKFVDEITPVVGPGSAGRSLFILLGYQAFKDRDDITGTPTLGWFEFRVVSTKAEDRKNGAVLVSLHHNLEHPIPDGSLMALANIQWFKEEPPASN